MIVRIFLNLLSLSVVWAVSISLKMAKTIESYREFWIISTENGVLLYKAQQSTPDSIISDAKDGEFLYPKVDKCIWAITSDERVGTTFQKH